MPQGKVAAGFVIFKRASNSILYLMMQTSYGHNHWTPPKGHVDPGETDEMVTAYRETMEESGLIKTDLKVYEDSKRVLRYKVKGAPKTVIYWLAELINSSAEVKLSREHQDFKWLPVDDACTIGNYEDMTEVLKSYEKYIENMK